VRRDKLLQGTVSQADIRDFGLTDGLRGVEGVKRHQSVFPDPSGRIWFSLNRGISAVDPVRLTSGSAPAIANVQTISADGSPLDLQGTVRIKGGRKRITFGYVGLSLSVPERVRFRYQLDGFDHGWSEPVATREAVYTNLSPGSYRFRVIASNPDGVWSSNEATVGFEVDPLFWQTWWFRMGVVMAFGMAVLALYRFRLHQVTKRLRGSFEERLAERTRIAQELHDTLLQGFLSASMQVHVAADRLASDSPAKPTLTRALQLMGQVIEEGRNAVRGLRSAQTASFDLEQAFARIQDELLADQVAFRVIVEGERRPLHPVLRDEVYRIGREALLNAFRHARAKSIEIELKYSSTQLRVFVRDDGCGIDPKLISTGTDGHWGLVGMRERADRIGARFHVFSNATVGTEIELSVPSHVAFVGQSHRRMRWFGTLQNSRNATSEKSKGKNGKGE
jgi:signal transduction histidine kinase